MAAEQVPSSTSELASDQPAYWIQKPDALLKTLKTSVNGLSQREASARLDRVGHNTLVTRNEVIPLGLFIHQFKSPIMLILIFATVFALSRAARIYSTTPELFSNSLCDCDFIFLLRRTDQEIFLSPV